VSTAHHVSAAIVFGWLAKHFLHGLLK